MIDATQAAIVAYMTEHGEIIHDSHLPDDVIEGAEEFAKSRNQPTGQGWRYFDEYIEDAGYTPLIRYSIHELESQNAYEIESNPHHFTDDDGLFVKRAALGNALSVLATDDEDYDITDPLRDILSEVEQDIEELIDALTAVRCDECGERIE
jgi:hypothetical protein